MLLPKEKVKEIIADFLAKYSKELEYIMYPFNEIVCRQGEIKPKIYIVKEGVFKIGKVDTPELTNTLGFCFENDIRTPLGVFSSKPQTQISLFELRSIENNLTQCNSMYEITLEQWDAFAKKDKIFDELILSSFLNNFNDGFVFMAMLRQNRKLKELFEQMYNAKHPILNSGISEKYIAEFFGTTPKSLKRLHIEAKYNSNKK